MTRHKSLDAQVRLEMFVLKHYCLKLRSVQLITLFFFFNAAEAASKLRKLKAKLPVSNFPKISPFSQMSDLEAAEALIARDGNARNGKSFALGSPLSST